MIRVVFFSLVLAGLCFLSGCALAPIAAEREGREAGVRETLPDATPLWRESLRLARAGSQALREARYGEANTLFNRALRLEPENAQFNFLNALAYHLAWRAGTQRDPELAETGYLLALRLDPTFAEAAAQLGTLYVELKRNSAAIGALSQSIALKPESAETHYALAYSAYYAQDAELAAWAARRASSTVPDNPAYLRAAALTSAAAGDKAGVERYFAAAAKLSPATTTALNLRLERWKAVHNEIADGHQSELKPPSPLAQAGPPSSNNWGGGYPSGPYYPPGPSIEGASQHRSPEQSKMASSDAGPMQKKWSDCADNSSTNLGGGYPGGPGGPGGYLGGPGGPYSSGGTSSGGDETNPLPALPSPCKGLPLPRMVMLDATIMRTEEQDGSSHGVNLLEGLQVVLTGSRSVNRTTTGSPQRQVTQTGALALPTAGVTYALNIANASTKRTEVIARPTLVALDRMPSMFFTGSNVSVLVPGTLTGGGLQEKPIGVSMSVTPTFIDDDTMLLAVKATRSFVESGVNSTFTQSLSTTRASVTANVIMKFDQSLVLSGLRERDQQESDAGVPFLRDIPGIQYLFAQSKTSDFTKEVVVVITPRRPKHLAEAIEASRQHLLRQVPDSRGNHEVERVKNQARKESVMHTTNQIAILAALSDNRFYSEFRSGDISSTSIPLNFSLERMLREIWQSILF